MSFRPQKEIEAKLGDGQTLYSGPSFARLRYIVVSSSVHYGMSAEMI